MMDGPRLAASTPTNILYVDASRRVALQAST
jgi:hypothetical protein